MTERLPIYDSVVADHLAGRLETGRHEWVDPPVDPRFEIDPPTVRLPRPGKRVI